MTLLKTIGVVAGAGPFAGVDLLQKLFQQTLADGDKDHLNVIGLFKSSQLPDRTCFLLQHDIPNPGHAIAAQALELYQAGAEVAGIPCNTAHSAEIFEALEADLQAENCPLKFLHMIRETGLLIRENYPQVRRVGVLGTTGTYKTAIYPQHLGPLGYEVLLPELELQENKVHPAIYDPQYGIKSGQITPRAREDLLQAAASLLKMGAEAIVLGCTEIPLAIQEKKIGEAVVIDPAVALARAMIREVAPKMLRPYQV